MATTSNILTGLGTDPAIYREMSNKIGIITTSRAKPKMLSQGLEGYNLGLYNEVWANHIATASGAVSYYARIVPIYDKMSDPDGNPLRGTPNTVNTTKGTTFDFDPFPDGYGCTGYEVWAGTESGADADLYYQGLLDGQFNTHFVVGTTWSYNSSGSSLSPNDNEVPPFVNTVEVYQAEGDSNSRVFLGGGKKYDSGYAKVAQNNVEPVVTGGTGAEDDYAIWDTISDASLRLRIDNEWFEIVSIDFLGVASMAAVAAILHTAVRQAQAPKLISGSATNSTLTDWTDISKGTFRIVSNSVGYDFEGIDCTSALSMSDVASTIQTKMREDLPNITCEWDSSAERFIISSPTTTGSDQIVNGSFAADTDWTKDAEWTISGGKANVSNSGQDDITNGSFASDTGWTKGSYWSISGGQAHQTYNWTGGSAWKLSQTTLTPGTAYTLTLNVKPSAILLGEVYLHVSGATSKTWTINAESWNYLTLNFTAASSAIEIAISTSINKTTGVDNLLDNVTAKRMTETEMYQTKASGDWNSKTWSVSYTLSGMGTGENFRIEIRDSTGSVVGATGATRTADGTYTDILSVPSGSTYNRIYLIDASTATSSYSVDNVSMTEQIPDAYLSYADRHSGNLGTDISAMMACRGTSTGVVLNRKGKTASFDTVEWDTDKFVFTRHPISVLSDPSAGGTYIGGASWMNGESGTGTVDGKKLTCGTAGDTTPANWAAISDGEITMALYGTAYSITGIDFTGDTTMDMVAATLQAALRAETGKTETVTYNSADTRFEIELDTNADVYRLSLLESATANVGTDISGSTYLDMDSASAHASYTPGQTALRSVLGTGVEWGEWCKGMEFGLQGEGYRWLIAKYSETFHVVLDEDYEGDGFDGYHEYVFQPFDDQIYVSNLGNPFRYDTSDIVKLPTSDSDGIVSINRAGFSIAVFMQHHTWFFNSTDITAPRLISNQIGAYNADSVIYFNNGVAVFTGEDFVHVRAGRIVSLDPESRMREVISRLSTSAPPPHGRYIVTGEAKVLKWFMGLDGSTVINTAIVYDVRRGNWWLENVKNAQSSVVLRDTNDDTHLLTASSYDDAHGIKAHTYLHSGAYKNDGAIGPCVQGLIDSVGASTETAGYLTCAKAGSSAIGDWNTITKGYFSITIDGLDLDCGPCDFSGASDMAAVATIIENAIVAAGDSYATVEWSTDHFVFTSGTITNRSNVLYTRPYYPAIDITDISNASWINGQDGQGVITRAVSQTVFTLDDMDSGASALLATADDGEEGTYLYVCDTSLDNGQYVRVVENTANTVTVTPKPYTMPKAGWFWFMGGIVPSITKWFDWGSPQHKNKIFGISVGVDPNESSSGNRLGIHGMQDLKTKVRTRSVLPLGGNADTVNSFHLRDVYATQQGIKLLRPNSEHDFKLRSITITHAPRT